jgi:hypothetical protein
VCPAPAHIAQGEPGLFKNSNEAHLAWKVLGSGAHLKKSLTNSPEKKQIYVF